MDRSDASLADCFYWIMIMCASHLTATTQHCFFHRGFVDFLLRSVELWLDSVTWYLAQRRLSLTCCKNDVRSTVKQTKTKVNKSNRKKHFSREKEKKKKNPLITKVKIGNLVDI